MFVQCKFVLFSTYELYTRIYLQITQERWPVRKHTLRGASYN